MRKWIFEKVAVVVLGMGFVFSGVAKAEGGDAKAVSGFVCIGAYSYNSDCSTYSPGACLNTAQFKCLPFGGPASYSCESCAYYSAKDQDSNPVRDGEAATMTAAPDTCPQTGVSGWYARMWYTCNN